jgi:hypothetical protein
MSEGWLILAIIVGLFALGATPILFMERLWVAGSGAAAVLAVCVSFCTWWGVTEPESGTVVRRHWSPAHYQMSCNDKGICTTTYIPECYEITYHDPAAPHDGSTCVTPHDYETRWAIGDHYPDPR